MPYYNKTNTFYNKPWLGPDAYALIDKLAAPPAPADGVVPALLREKTAHANPRHQRTSTGLNVFFSLPGIIGLALGASLPCCIAISNCGIKRSGS